MDTGHEDERQQGKTCVFGKESGKKCIIVKYRFASVSGNFPLS